MRRPRNRYTSWMSFDTLPFADKNEIVNALAAALSGYAMGPNGPGNPLAHDPVGSAERDARLVHNSGWAQKIDGRWLIDLDAYLDYRASLS